LNEPPATLSDEPGAVQPVSEYSQGGDKEKVRQLMGIEAFGRRVSLEGPGCFGREDKEAAESENLGPINILFCNLRGHSIAYQNGLLMNFFKPQNIEQGMSSIEVITSLFCGSLFCCSIFDGLERDC